MTIGVMKGKKCHPPRTATTLHHKYRAIPSLYPSPFLSTFFAYHKLTRYGASPGRAPEERITWPRHSFSSSSSWPCGVFPGSGHGAANTKGVQALIAMQRGGVGHGPPVTQAFPEKGFTFGAKLRMLTAGYPGVAGGGFTQGSEKGDHYP